jgi:hypothetical protein
MISLLLPPVRQCGRGFALILPTGKAISSRFQSCGTPDYAPTTTRTGVSFKAAMRRAGFSGRPVKSSPSAKPSPAKEPPSGPGCKPVPESRLAAGAAPAPQGRHSEPKTKWLHSVFESGLNCGAVTFMRIQ